MRTADAAAIAEGFYEAVIERLDDRRWRISDRGALQTLRFDPPLDDMRVDMKRSTGVLGYRHDMGALYVALDPAVETSVVALARGEAGAQPSLVDSRWPVAALWLDGDGFSFIAGGFGAGEMRWRAVPRARYRVTSGRSPAIEVVADGEGLLAFTLDPVDGRKVDVRVAGPL